MLQMAHADDTDSTDAADAPHSTDPAKELIDQPLADDIELLGEVVVAAAEADEVMTDPEVDEALGVSPEGQDPPRTSHDA
jgi:hypothetical protein